MSRVKILPEILSNKIAAGEVVERPASVVKELVENALDAGSSRVLITLENAGKSLIRVSDNGCGMGRDDALLSIERYATSKIATDKDLFSIATLGFRGEALPSIASVSKFSLESREKTSETGVRVEVEGGKLVSVTDAGLPVGTQITVAHLFYNIPARRKFLKTNDTELGHVVDTVASIALAWPGTQFQLVHNGKPLKIWPAVEEVSSRIVDVAGKDLEKGLFPVSFSRDGVSLSGWLASGRTVRSTPKGIYLYVNSRFVRDTVVRQGLLAGFAGKLLTGRFPVAVLFLTVPPDQVDVNVHPTKHQVRFADPRGIHRLIETAVSETLRILDRPFSTTLVSEPGISEERADFGNPTSWAPTLSEVPEPPAPEAFSPAPALLVAPEPEQRDPSPVAPAAHVAVLIPRSVPLPVPETVQQPLFPQKKAFENLKLIGQLHDTYLVCESSREGMVLIDQHAAHERILFEKLAARGTPETQRLLLPETLELGFSEARILEGMLSDLAEFGFDVEPFGGNTFVVKAAPSLLAGREIAPLIMEMVEKSAETGVSPELAEPLDRVRQLIACHGAIRANQRLSSEQMKGLLTALDACHTPGACPHGRPTWIEWRIPAIEKAFFRVL